MDPEIKRLLEETKALAKDNHRMLSAIRRDQWLGFIGRVIVWVVVLALPLYLYQQYIRPIVEKFTSTTELTTTGLFGFPTAAELKGLLDSFTGGK